VNAAHEQAVRYLDLHTNPPARKPSKPPAAKRAAAPKAKAKAKPKATKARKPAAPKPEATRHANGLRRRGRQPAEPPSGRPTSKSARTMLARRGELKEPRDVRELLDSTLRAITSRHGSSQGFLDWLTCRKMLASVDALEQKRRRERGELLARALVDQHVIGWVEALHRELLTTAAEALADAVGNLALSGATREQWVTAAVETLSGHVSGLKRRVLRGIRASEVPSGTIPRSET